MKSFSVNISVVQLQDGKWWLDCFREDEFGVSIELKQINEGNVKPGIETTYILDMAKEALRECIE